MDIENGQIRFIVFGELDPNDDITNKAANKLGFEYFRAEGCTVDQPFINAVSIYNNKVTKFLNQQNPNWQQKLDSIVNHLKKKSIFQQDESFEILEIKQLSDYPSSDPDTSYCSDWKLTENEMVNILKLTQPISRPDWHHLFAHYPCVYRGTLSQNKKILNFAINAGSWLTITSDTTIYYGDLSGILSELFLDTVWKEENEQ
jgi:hypothetical protein